MTLKGIEQDKSILKDEILEKLIVLKKIVGDDQIGICRRLGYSKDVFSRVKTDQNYFGSPQLLAGLLLLIELETLKREREEVLAIKRSLQHLMAPTSKYMMNDAPQSSPNSEPREPAPAAAEPSPAQSETPTAYVKRRLRKKLPPA